MRRAGVPHGRQRLNWQKLKKERKEGNSSMSYRVFLNDENIVRTLISIVREKLMDQLRKSLSLIMHKQVRTRSIFISCETDPCILISLDFASGMAGKTARKSVSQIVLDTSEVRNTQTAYRETQIQADDALWESVQFRRTVSWRREKAVHYDKWKKEAWGEWFVIFLGQTEADRRSMNDTWLDRTASFSKQCSDDLFLFLAKDPEVLETEIGIALSAVDPIFFNDEPISDPIIRIFIYSFIFGIFGPIIFQTFLLALTKKKTAIRANKKPKLNNAFQAANHRTFRKRKRDLSQPIRKERKIEYRIVSIVSAAFVDSTWSHNGIEGNRLFWSATPPHLSSA